MWFPFIILLRITNKLWFFSVKEGVLDTPIKKTAASSRKKNDEIYTGTE